MRIVHIGSYLTGPGSALSIDIVHMSLQRQFTFSGSGPTTLYSKLLLAVTNHGRWLRVQVAAITAMFTGFDGIQMTSEYWIKSFMLPWMDPAAASTRKTYTTSHGATWDLVISDELNAEGRSFDPGDDQLHG
ncbi:hypothetical protein PC110_g7401 [Phytophthora cactorum]|uniref:Uncharacterized protein n=2 Tax=Phytophthora cactorum TaxID=29920 RepID=A0A329SHS0_9STRA|nr:hypothetical protein PC110_g7401 [Phytophthora cactorum]